MEKTIIIKRIYRNTGTTKDGKPYTLTKLLAGGKYYTTFKPMPAGLAEGQSLQIECEPTEKPDIFRLIKIISYAANPAREAQPVATTTASPGFEAVAEYAAALLREAKAIADKETPEWKDTSEYPYLIATLIQTMHGKLMAEQIAQNDAKKLKAYGKEAIK
ncbi:MAG: hypothetical protein QXS81_04315 [Candidatus Micrarchaeaceae archaeon]